jgi:hypothetical protein
MDGGDLSPLHPILHFGPGVHDFAAITIDAFLNVLEKSTDLGCRNAPKISSRKFAINIWEIGMKTRMNINLAPPVGSIFLLNHPPATGSR